MGSHRAVIAPTLFSMMFSAMLMDAFQDSDTAFPIRYRFDDKIFNLRRLQAKTKVQNGVLNGLLYADDMDKNASSKAKMQPWIKSHSHVITIFSQSAQKDRGCTPTSTWKTVQRTNYHSEWTKTESC